MFTFSFTAQDWFTRFTGLGSNEVQVPKTTLLRTALPGLPTALEGACAPWIYGGHTAEVGSCPPPVNKTTPDRDGFYDGGWSAGFGDNVSTATPPTSVSAGASAGGSMNLGDVPANRYYVCVQSKDSLGQWSKPYPFPQSSGYDVTIAADAQKISVSWSGATGAVLYRCFTGHYYFGIRWMQYIDTASTSCEFDAHPPFGADAPIATGAVHSSGGGIHYYIISTICTDGETATGPEWQWVSHGIDRPAFLEWFASTGATGYRIYKRNAGSSWYSRYDVGAVTNFTDYMDGVGWVAVDGLPVPRGLLPVTYVGQLPDAFGVMRHAFLVAGHAVKSIPKVFQNGVDIPSGSFGGTIHVPGWATFNTLYTTPYRDIGGQRLTFIYAIGPQGDAAADGSQPFTVWVEGIEDVGDASGVLIEDLSLQYKHFLRNAVCNDWRTGNWFTTGPTWGDTPIDVDVIDDASFNAVKLAWDDRIVGGCLGRWVLGRGESGSLERQSVRTWLARLNLSLDVRATPATRKAQYSIFPQWRTEVEVAAGTHYTAERGILKDSFRMIDRPEKIENQITVQYNLQMTATNEEGHWSLDVHEDLDAQEAILNQVMPRTLTLWCVYSPSIADLIGDWRLLRRRFPSRYVEFESDMGALLDDVGTVIRVTHPDGYGSAGWVNQPCIISRHEFDPDGKPQSNTGFQVRFTAEDIGWMFEDEEVIYRRR
jgi:hypothetical protein